MAIQENKEKQYLQECINNCLDCHKICLETITECLEMGERHSSAAHIKLLQDCAQICLTSADFMIRMSGFHPQTCGVCADVCQACAEDCEKLANGEDFMKECARICRRCAETCREMSGTARIVGASK